MSHPGSPLPLGSVTVNDPFWSIRQERVRTEVIPYQWKALNDQVEGAAPSFVIHNFEAAARQTQQRGTQGKDFVAPTLSSRGFETWPTDPENPDPDTFYGFLFQDSDLGKFIEAAAYSLGSHPDPGLEARVDEVIELVCAAQLENGYLDTYYILTGMDRAFTNLQNNHELYCFGHMTEAAVAYHEVTGKDALLQAMERFAAYISSRIGPEEGKLHGYPGHEEAEIALVRLYEATGKPEYLEMARYFIDQRGASPNFFVEERERAVAAGIEQAGGPVNLEYYQAHRPVREQDEVLGHAVRAGYLLTAMADVARLTQDASLVEACERLWRNIVDRKLYVTGGIGGTEHGEAFSFEYDLPNDLAYSETCAAISLAFFARRMLQLRVRSEYADVMELALYNTVIAGVALDGKSFFYVNPLEVEPGASRRDSRKHHVKPVRQPWFGCACCPPNAARIIADVQSYAYTGDGSTLFTHLYLGGRVRTQLGGQDLEIEVSANLPWSGTGSAVIHAADGPVAGTLAFRVPGWSGDDGSAITCSADVTRQITDGYVYLTGTWADGDQVTFDFPMPTRLVAAHTAVRENVGQVALMRGPVTFALEEVDNGPDLHLLSLASEAFADGGIRVEDWDGLGEPMVRLRVPALRQESSGEGALYAEYRPVATSPVTATFIPYFAWANRGENEMRVWIRG